MKKLAAFGLALVSSALISPLAYAGSPSVVGSWNVTFTLEPSRSTGATQCIVFRLVPGTVAGVATSGTWFSPTFPGWTGQWIQLGDHVRWFGVTPGLATSESGNVESPTRFNGVSFNHFLKGNAMTSSAGSWHALRVSACGRADRAPTITDPSKMS